MQQKDIYHQIREILSKSILHEEPPPCCAKVLQDFRSITVNIRGLLIAQDGTLAARRANIKILR